MFLGVVAPLGLPMYLSLSVDTFNISKTYKNLPNLPKPIKTCKNLLQPTRTIKKSVKTCKNL